MSRSDGAFCQWTLLHVGISSHAGRGASIPFEHRSDEKGKRCTLRHLSLLHSMLCTLQRSKGPKVQRSPSCAEGLTRHPPRYQPGQPLPSKFSKRRRGPQPACGRIGGYTVEAWSLTRLVVRMVGLAHAVEAQVSGRHRRASNGCPSCERGHALAVIGLTTTL